MEDIVPDLLNKIERKFTTLVEADKDIIKLNTRIRDGTATLHETSLYARKLGDHLSEAMQEFITEDSLPDGRMYYNIADRIVTPLMRKNFDLTNAKAIEVQKLIDSKQEIGLNPIAADFPEDRVKQIVDSLTQEDVDFEVIHNRMGEPIRNCSQSFFDDFIRANVDFRARAGLQSYIVRTLVGGACPYCVRLAGTYEYGEEPKDVYKRHDSCRCTVTYKTEKYQQNAHTKTKLTWEQAKELQNSIIG
jgi:hypothetical protein